MINEQDLTRIFDKRWKVNKETSRRISEHNKELNEKLFGIKEPKNNIPNYNENRLQRLNEQMENLRNTNRNKFRG